MGVSLGLVDVGAGVGGCGQVEVAGELVWG